MVKYRFNVSFYEWIKIYINSDGSSSSNECDMAVCSKQYGQVSGGIPSPIVDLLLTKRKKEKEKGQAIWSNQQWNTKPCNGLARESPNKDCLVVEAALLQM